MTIITYMLTLHPAERHKETFNTLHGESLRISRLGLAVGEGRGATVLSRLSLTRALEGGILCPHLFFANNLKTAARSSAKFSIYLLTIHEHTLCAKFDFLGQKVRSPGQVKVRCAPRDRLQTSTSRCGHSYSPNDLTL